MASRAWRRSGQWQLSGSLLADTPLYFLLFSSVLQAGACLVAGAPTADRNVKGELEGTRGGVESSSGLSAQGLCPVTASSDPETESGEELLITSQGSLGKLLSTVENIEIVFL